MSEMLDSSDEIKAFAVNKTQSLLAFSTQSDVALLDVSKCDENEEDGFHVKGQICLERVAFIGFVEDYVVLMT